MTKYLSKSNLCDKGFILARGGKSMAESTVWANAAGISHVAADQEAGTERTGEDQCCLLPVLCTRGTGLHWRHLSSAEINSLRTFLVKPLWECPQRHRKCISWAIPNPVAASHHVSTVSSPRSPLRWVSSQANMEHSQPKEDKVRVSLNSLSKQRLKIQLVTQSLH